MKTLCCFFLLLSLSIFADKHYSLTFEDEAEDFSIRVQTLREKSSICKLIINSLYLEIPSKEKPGVIAFDVIPDPNGIHLYAFGKRTGFFLFPKGMEFPRISPGSYRLVIDNFEYGTIYIDDSLNAKLDNDIFHEKKGLS